MSCCWMIWLSVNSFPLEALDGGDAGNGNLLGHSIGQIKTEDEEQPVAKKRRGAGGRQRSSKEVPPNEGENETKGENHYMQGVLYT